LLGMRVHDRRSGGQRAIHIEMSDVVTKLLQDFGLHRANESKTPFSADAVTHLGAVDDEDRARAAKHDVRGLLGRLLWISVCARPDIAWAVNFVARYAHDPGSIAWTALCRIARYLKGTRGHGLAYTANDDDKTQRVHLTVHVDSDHAGCPDTRRSTTGAIYSVNGVAIHWRSRRQTVAVRSSTEAEMLAVADAAADITYFRDLLRELHHPQLNPTPVHCDNAGTVRNAMYPTNKRTRHLNVPFAVVRDRQQQGDLELRDVHTGQNQADMPTKPLGPTKLAQHRTATGVVPPHPTMRIISAVRAARSRHKQTAARAPAPAPTRATVGLSRRGMPRGCTVGARADTEAANTLQAARMLNKYEGQDGAERT